KKIKIEESLMNDNLAFISGFIKLNKKEACSIKSLDLILSSESDSYKIPAQKRVRPDLSFKNNAHSVGFSSFFSNLNLISEKYVILLRVCSLDSCKIYPYSEKKFIRN
ncbi:MAG: hypothetical protein KDD56_09390, partial [Bdellovibrionales bacterium]|nr:hypothetical protein [Bdellovibrionales bacterium]